MSGESSYLRRLAQYEQELAQIEQDVYREDVATPAEREQLDAVRRLIQTLRQALATGAPAGDEVDPPPTFDPAEDLSVGDAADRFQPEYMDRVMESRPAGADSPDLNAAMEGLLKRPGDAEKETYLEVIARETGMSLGQTQNEYAKFLALSAQAQAAADRRDDDDLESPEMIDEAAHGSHLGSTASLRYGKIVGDHFGVNAVFGAMLNPTGGIVGAGNEQLYDGDPDDPLVKHGVVHDAAGYLKNYHGDGPGYDYLQREGRDTTDPYTGQESGVQYWLDRDGREDLESDVMRTAASAWGVGLDAKEAVEGAYEEAETAAAETYTWAQEQRANADRWADETTSEAEAAVDQAWAAVGNAANSAKEAVEEVTSRAEESVASVPEAARQSANDVRNTAQKTADAVSDVAQTIGRSVPSAAHSYQYADEQVQRAAEYWDSLWN